MYQIQFRLGLCPRPGWRGERRGRGLKRRGPPRVPSSSVPPCPKSWKIPWLQNWSDWRGGNTDVCPGRQTPSRRHCVRLSVCLSVTRVDCDKSRPKWWTADILILHESAITLLFWHQQWLVGDAPSIWNLRSKWPTPLEKRRLRQICSYNVSTVR